MKLIIGLGNPGSRYTNTRHNLGFRIVESLALALDAQWTTKSQLHADIAEGRLGREKIVMAKPTTFMNLSGDAVAALRSMYKAPTEDIWIVHDDIDLALGKVKVQRGRSSAGHNGVEHIIQVLKTKDFVRFRIGIDARVGDRKIAPTEAYVMARFSKDDEKTLSTLIPSVDRLIQDAIATTLEKAMSRWGQ